jgi:hypothetical protein
MKRKRAHRGAILQTDKVCALQQKCWAGAEINLISVYVHLVYVFSYINAQAIRGCIHHRSIYFRRLNHHRV